MNTINNPSSPKRHLAIFASGNGTNAQQIIEYFAHHPSIEVACVVYNRKEAFVAERARLLGVESRYFSNAQIRDTEQVDDYLRLKHVDFIILAGFLLLLPTRLLDAFPRSVINIHPSLLPLHGGKGMFGDHVHQAVISAGEKESGITIHLVNQLYDDGAILFQATCPVTSDDSVETLAAKIHKLEKRYFPPVIEAFVSGTPMPII